MVISFPALMMMKSFFGRFKNRKRTQVLSLTDSKVAYDKHTQMLDGKPCIWRTIIVDGRFDTLDLPLLI
jgi:hypothetical protein